MKDQIKKIFGMPVDCFLKYFKKSFFLDRFYARLSYDMTGSGRLWWSTYKIINGKIYGRESDDGYLRAEKTEISVKGFLKYVDVHESLIAKKTKQKKFAEKEKAKAILEIKKAKDLVQKKDGRRGMLSISNIKGGELSNCE